MLADPSDRELEILGAFPYQPNEAVLHTDRALLPRRRRAWASWNYHLLEQPVGRPTVTYHMNRLQSLSADARLLRHAQPHRPRSTRRRSCAGSRTRTRSTRPPAPRPSSATTRSAAATAPTSAAPTGAGASTRTACAAPRASPSGWEASRCDPERPLRGHDPPPPLRGPPARAAPPHRDGLPRPRRAARRCSAAASSARRPGLVRFRRARLPRRSGRPARRRRPRARRRAAAAGSALLTNLRTLGHCFNPVSFYYCFDDAENLEAVVAEVTNTPWGERHAYVLDAPPHRARQGDARVALHGHGPALHGLASRRPGRRSRSTSRAARTTSRAFDATLKLHRRPLTASLGALRTLPLIYGHAVVLRAKGVRPR